MLVAAKAWDAFTKGQHEAAEAAKKNAEALDRLRDQQKGPVNLAKESFETQRKVVDDLSRSLAELTVRQRQAANPEGRFGRLAVPSLDSAALSAEREGLIGELAKASDRLATAARGVGDAETEAGAKAKRAHEEAAAAARHHLEDVLELQKALRVTAAGGGNLTQGGAGVPAAALGLPAINQGARQAGILSGEGDAIQRVREETQAWDRALDEAIRDSERAFREDRPRKLARALHDVTAAGREVLGAATNVGLIGEKAAGAIGSVLDLGDALGNLKNTAGDITLGGVAGLVGAGIGLIGSIFGGGPSERERLLQENNQRLAELKASLDDSLRTAAGLGATAAQVAAAGEFPRIRTGPRPGQFSFDQDAFAAQLARAGLTVEEWGARIQALTGFDVVDEKGRIVAASLAAADAAIRQLTEDITHFGTSLSDRDAVERARDELGISGRSDDPRIAAIQRARDLQLGGPGAQGPGLHLSEEEEARIRALDLTTKAGRDAFLAWERELFQRAEAGGLSPEELGTFTGVTELAGSIGDAASGINAFDDAMKAATQSLGDFNLPPGFKRNLFAFNASDFGPPPDMGPWPWQPDPWHDPTRRVPGPGDGASLPVPGDRGRERTSMTITGPIYITVDGSRSPTETAETILAKLRSIALSQSGDSMNFHFT